MKNILLIFGTLLFLLTGMETCHAAGPWRGKVIDAETKGPIEGAAVVAVWEKEFRLDPAGAHTYFLDAEEAVTDRNGEFEIPAKIFISIPLVRKVRAPRFTIFKPGYGSFPWHQVSPKHIPDDLFTGKGALVELPKLKTKEERIESNDGANTVAPWSKTPVLQKLINSERVQFGFEPVGN